jgi:hypothetical protein
MIATHESDYCWSRNWRKRNGRSRKWDLHMAKEEEVNTAYMPFKKSRRRAKEQGENIPLNFTLGSNIQTISPRSMSNSYTTTLCIQRNEPGSTIWTGTTALLLQKRGRRDRSTVVSISMRSQQRLWTHSSPNLGQAQGREDHW